jgi:hypothetical protein
MAILLVSQSRLQRLGLNERDEQRLGFRER